MTETKIPSVDDFAKEKGFENEEHIEYLKEIVDFEFRKGIGGDIEEIGVPEGLSEEDVKKIKDAAAYYVWCSWGANLPQPEISREVSPTQRLGRG